MSTKLQELIDEVQKLSPKEKLDLISAISHSLQPVCAERGDQDFWLPKSLETHSRRQGTPVVHDITELKGDSWPKDETADDLIAYIYNQRAEDRRI